MGEGNRQTEATERLAAVLADKAAEVYGRGARIEDLVRLSGGASRETWSFDVVTADGSRVPLILKRDPVFYRSDGSFETDTSRLGVSRLAEGRLMELARDAGVPEPEVPFYLEADERTTEGFVSRRLEGEVLGLRVLREPSFAEGRAKLAFQCGHAVARLQSIPLQKLPPLVSMDVHEELAYHHDIMRRTGHPWPGFEYGFRWLRERVGLAGGRHVLVHGDFRLGNIMVGPDGLRGVLDWETAHTGNSLHDLGWLCVRAWRYGYLKKPVGGFGEIEELLAGYEAGGGEPVGRDELHFWEVFGSVRWGMLCIHMGFSQLGGTPTSFEKTVIGRRAAEAEYDLMQIID